MNPVAQAFVRYLLGEQSLLSSCAAIIKGPGQTPLALHTDQPVHPIPRALVCNVTYLLTDYSREGGALCFVPGSHKQMRERAPAPANGLSGAAVPVEERR